MICQELNCKKQESRARGTLCKKHAEEYERETSDIYSYSSMKFKTIERKNSVWKNGIEHVRGMKTNLLDSWIKRDSEKINAIRKTMEILNNEIKELEEKIKDYERTKLMRYSK